MHFKGIPIVAALILTISTRAKVYKFLNYHQDLIIESVINSFGIKHCIYIKSDDDKDNDWKWVFKQNEMALVMDYEQLLEYLRTGLFANVNTAVIVKEEKLTGIVEVFQILNKLNMIYRVHHFSWLVFVESQDSLNADAEKLFVPYNCQFIISHPVNNKTYKLTEVYNIKNRTFFTDLGILQNDQISLTNNYLYLRRMDFNGTTFEMNTAELNYNKRYSRQYELLNDTAKILNIQYYYTDVASEWKAAVREHRAEDFALKGDIFETPYIQHSSHFRFDYYGPMFKFEINWYIKYPNADKNANYYIQPFHVHLWYLILFVVFLSGLVFLLMRNITEIFMKKYEKASSVDFAFIGLHLFCNQNGCRDFENVYLRIMVITLRIVALLIIPAYGAEITSYLAIQVPHIPFRNLNEFLENKNYILTLYRSRFIKYYYEASSDPIIRNAYENFSLYKNPYSSRSSEIAEFCNKHLALVAYDYDINDEYIKCRKLKIEQPLFTPGWNGIILKKNSPFKDVLNYNLIRFYSSGIQDKLQKLGDNRLIIESGFDETLEPVEVKQMVQVLSIVGVGVLLGGIVLLFELFYKRCSFS